MTQTIDPTKAEAPDLIRWLAEQPCRCSQGCNQGYHTDDPNYRTGVTYCEYCQGTGRAFPWASEPCPGESLESCQGEGCLICNGSGRVPKAVGLEELFEHGIDFVERSYSLEQQWAARFGSSWGYGETPLLAALRAVAKTEMARLGLTIKPIPC